MGHLTGNRVFRVNSEHQSFAFSCENQGSFSALTHCYNSHPSPLHFKDSYFIRAKGAGLDYS